MYLLVPSICVFISLLAQSFVGHILRLPCKEVGEFSIVKDNLVLQGSIINTFSGLEDFDCEHECRMNPQCKSINIEKEGSKLCQLNSVSTGEISKGESNLVAKSGWIYKTTNYNAKLIGENCQILKPCPQEFVCQDLCSCPYYECLLLPGDCMAWKKLGYNSSRIYNIAKLPNKPMKVFCDMKTDGGGWIVFQRRIDSTVDFQRTWSEYKNGFGDMSGNFWLGLEKLHLLAGPGKGATLMVELKHRTDANKVYAHYSTFEIGNEADGYRLNFAGYSGNASDSLQKANGMKFTTKDRDNDLNKVNCAIKYKGGWWHKKCFSANLNNLYPTSTNPSSLYMSWKYLKNAWGNIMFSEMKLRFLI